MRALRPRHRPAPLTLLRSERLRKFERFLEHVVDHQGTGVYMEIADILNRYNTLSTTHTVRCAAVRARERSRNPNPLACTQDLQDQVARKVRDMDALRSEIARLNTDLQNQVLVQNSEVRARPRPQLPHPR